MSSCWSAVGSFGCVRWPTRRSSLCATALARSSASWKQVSFETITSSWTTWLSSSVVCDETHGQRPDVRLTFTSCVSSTPRATSYLSILREFLTSHHFTEIITSKIVASGTEGGTNLFAISYFDRIAYLAQSPQFYKEHGVAAFERVFETGHVYRAEPHASSRHLTEYYSLDLEFGFIDGPEDVIDLEKQLLTRIFELLNQHHGDLLLRYRSKLLPSLMEAPVWEFGDCLQMLAREHGTSHLKDDLDPPAERQLCALAEAMTGVPAVFVLGFPASSRPFYSAPRGAAGAAQSFDLLFEGLEITTGGQRLHSRDALEAALRHRGIEPSTFEDHLRMFELGMPPHGGLAIGLERLTCQILGLQNVREAVLYPRDRYHLSP